MINDPVKWVCLSVQRLRSIRQISDVRTVCLVDVHRHGHRLDNIDEHNAADNVNE